MLCVRARACTFLVLSFLVISVSQLVGSYVLLEDPLNLHLGESAVLNSFSVAI